LSRFATDNDVNNVLIERATETLFNVVIPKYANHLINDLSPNELKELNVTNSVHEHGINLRFV
jgi:hypothetical protein